MTRASLIDQRRAVLTARRRGGVGSIGDDPFLTLVIEIRVVRLTIRPVGFRDVGDLVSNVRRDVSYQKGRVMGDETPSAHAG